MVQRQNHEGEVTPSPSIRPPPAPAAGVRALLAVQHGPYGYVNCDTYKDWLRDEFFFRSRRNPEMM